jgi:coenzyme F420-dependent glucose-6-phosphate dehydrogenase
MPPQIGLQVSLDQIQPDAALKYVVLAEKSGFHSIWVSDHFLPWSDYNGSGGFAWSWLGSVGEATKKIKIGTGLTCPIFRYHPAVIAQASATLNSMYGERVFLSVGTGEIENEGPLGYNLQSYKWRAERLEEAIDIIRKLWTGRFVNFHGKHYTLKMARLYTPPKTRIPLFVAGSGPKAAELAGRLGDGFLTFATDPAHIKELFAALERGAEKAGGRLQDKQTGLELWASYDEDYDKAVESLKPLAASLIPMFSKLAEFDPREMDHYGSLMGNDGIVRGNFVLTSGEEFIRLIEKYSSLGFSDVHFNSRSPSHENLIELFRKEVIPYFDDTIHLVR